MESMESWKPFQKKRSFSCMKHHETATVQRLKLSSFTKLLSLVPTRPRSLGRVSTSHRKVRQKLHSASKVAMAALFEASGLIISTIIWLIRRGNTSKIACTNNTELKGGDGTSWNIMEHPIINHSWSFIHDLFFYFRRMSSLIFSHPQFQP